MEGEGRVRVTVPCTGHSSVVKIRGREGARVAYLSTLT